MSKKPSGAPPASTPSPAAAAKPVRAAAAAAAAAADAAAAEAPKKSIYEAGRCRLTLSNPVLKAPTASAIETIYDELLSNVAFMFNLRRYNEMQLDNICDEDGGIKLKEKMPNFVWLMRNVEKNAERSLVIKVISVTKVRRCT